MGIFNYSERNDVNSLSDQLVIHNGEPQIAVFDFKNDLVYIKDTVTPANNFLGTVQGAIDSAVMTFARASSASMFGQPGSFGTVGNNIWRRVYDPKTQAILGYLPEPARTNYALRSNEFTNAAWTKANCTALDNNITVKGVSFSRITVTASAAASCIQTVAGVGVAAGMTYSVFVMKGTGATVGNRFILRNATTATSLVSAVIDLDTGALTVTLGAAIAYDYGGFWRIDLYTSTGINASDNLQLYCGFTGALQTAGEFVWVAHAQLENGLWATSRITTTTASASRSGDQMRIAWGKIPGTLAEYTLFGTWRGPYQASPTRIAALHNSSINDSFSIYPGAPGANTVLQDVRSGGVAYVANVKNAVNPGLRHKMGAAGAANDHSLVVDGLQGGVFTGTAPMPTALQFLDFGNYINTIQLCEPIESVVFIPRRVSNADMITRTA